MESSLTSLQSVDSLLQKCINSQKKNHQNTYYRYKSFKQIDEQYLLLMSDNPPEVETSYKEAKEDEEDY
jgi:hypothetical protein